MTNVHTKWFCMLKQRILIKKKTRRIKSIKDGKVKENRYVMDCVLSSLMVLTRRLSLCLSGGKKGKYSLFEFESKSAPCVNK